jgi:hypothetical protein
MFLVVDIEGLLERQDGDTGEIGKGARGLGGDQS